MWKGCVGKREVSNGKEDFGFWRGLLRFYAELVIVVLGVVKQVRFGWRLVVEAAGGAACGGKDWD